MKIHEVLYGIAFVSGLLGYGGLDGVITYGTGICTCAVLIAICGISAVWGMYEDGVLGKRK